MPDSYNEQYRIAMESKDLLTVKTVSAFVAGIVVLIFSVVPLPTIVVAIVSLICIAAVYGLCFHELTDGLVSVFRLSPSNDSLCAAALLFGAAQSVWLLFSSPESPAYMSFVVLFAIAVSMLMKLLYVIQIIKNIDIINSNKTYFVDAADIDLKKRFISKVFMVNPVIEFPEVLQTTYENDPAEKKNRFFVPAVIASCILLAVGVGIFRGANMFFVTLASVGACGACFTGEMAFVLPYIMAQHRLRQKGSILLGAASVERLKDIDTLVVEDSDLFPDNCAGIVNIRFFKKSYVSKALEYAAVLLDEINSPIAPSVFETLDCDRETLPHVSFIKNIQNHGVTARVNGEDVLLGNRNLLLSHDIAPLSQEQEATYKTMNRSLFYLAVQGELVAVLLVQYSADPALKQIVERIGGNFNVIVETRDCNINEYMVQNRYDLKGAHILVPEGDERRLLHKTREQVDDKKASPVMITTKNAIGILSSVEKAKKLSAVLETAIFTNKFSIVLGIALTAAAALAVPSLMTGFWVLLYNLLWTAPIIYLALK